MRNLIIAVLVVTAVAYGARSVDSIVIYDSNVNLDIELVREITQRQSDDVAERLAAKAALQERILMEMFSAFPDVD